MSKIPAAIVVFPFVFLLSLEAVVGSEPIANDSLVFVESDGVVSVEAEHFFKQDSTSKRAFYLTHAHSIPTITPDGDPSHIEGASGGAYIEVLPDTRRTHGDKLIRGENFFPEPGKQAVLHYKVHFKTTGRYYVWVRAYSTGSEDNGLHVGVDGEWPESGQRMQWCEGKKSWRWESKQRTQANHCGEPHKIFIDIDQPGQHTISFSMREDGFEFDKWMMTLDRQLRRPEGVGPKSEIKSGQIPAGYKYIEPSSTILTQTPTLALQQPRKPHGDGAVEVSGELRLWHKVVVDLHGPFAHELDRNPNPFTDYKMTVRFEHSSGRSYDVPGFFAADGNAAETSADSGTVWRAHFSPDELGEWTYTVLFDQGKGVALDSSADRNPLMPFDGATGSFDIEISDKAGRDLRSEGRLQYVNKHYLRFAGSKRYFLKAGADAPETLLAFADFDNTTAGNPKKAPLKSWSAHVRDWTAKDPVWRDEKGKGLIGAINYLSGKGCNAFSFLTYNAGGDGDNVWPFVQRDGKMQYDCSKLDQWGIVFDHGTAKGMYLHFKLQETENDDNKKGKNGNGRVNESLDGGELGPRAKAVFTRVDRKILA